jgi:hypothetical protein
LGFRRSLLQIIHQKAQTTNTAQSTSRKALQTEGELSVYIAQARLIQKRKQEAELENKRASTILKKRLS